MFKKILMKIYTSIKINIVIFKTKRLKLKRIYEKGKLLFH